MNTKKESDYVVCSKCKSTIVINKIIPFKPNGYPNISAEEYSRIKLGSKAFNPYHFNNASPFHLDPGFEKTVVESAVKTNKDGSNLNVTNFGVGVGSKTRELVKNSVTPNKKISKYTSFLDTINEISASIHKDYLSPQKKNRSISEIMYNNLFKIK
jgi:hypothetical protein